MESFSDLCPIFFIGHLIADEQSPLRKHLLYLFAKYVEVPLLYLAYHATVGSLRFLTAWDPARRALGRLLGYPVAHWVDTGSPIPTEPLLDLIDEQAEAIAVGPCRCRTAHGRCNHRMETDIVIRTGTAAWLKAFPDQYRIIDKQEARRIVEQCAQEGMFHMVFVHCQMGGALNEYVLCNCCRDGCSVYLANYHLGQKRFPLIPGNYYVRLVSETCESCGKCVEACPWDARTIKDKKPAVDLSRCFGCGLCAVVCEKKNTVMELKENRLPFRSHEQFHEANKQALTSARGHFQDAKK